MNFKKLLLLLIITVASVASHAADRYWVSNVIGFSNWNNAANWSTTSGGAGGASVPGVNDMAIFDTNGSSACRVNVNANIFGIHLRNGYNGNVDMQAGITMVIGAGNATFNDAAFNGADGDITVNGNFTIIGSNFISTNGILTITKDFTYLLGGFDERAGTVRFSGGNQTLTGTLGFHNLELTGSGNKDINPTNIWFVRNLFTFSSNQTININGGSIWVYRDMLISNTSTYSGGTGKIRLTGSNNQTITSTSAVGRGHLPNVEISKTGGLATFDGIVSAKGNWTYVSGNVDYTTNDATVALTGGDQTISGGETFNNLHIHGIGTKNITAPSTVIGLFTFASNGTININGDPINVMGDVNISNMSSYNSGSGLIRITGANNQTISSTSAVGRGELPNVEINKSGGTATFNGIVSTIGNWTYVGGNVDYTTNDATVALTGGDQTISGGETFNNLHIHGIGTKNITAPSTVLGLFTFASNGTININGDPINVMGDVNISNMSSYNSGSSLIRITGANNQTITSTSAVGRGELPNVEINKSGGTATFNGIISTTGNWTYVGGNVDYTTNDATIALTGSNQTISGGETFNNLHIHGSGTKNITAPSTVLGLFTFASNVFIHINGDPINVEGDMLISNTHASNNGTGLIRITGANNQTITSTSAVGRGELPNVEINKSGGTATFDGIVSTIGNWTYVGGNVDYTTNDATIAITGGNQTISGGETFNNLHVHGSGTKSIAATITALGLFTFSSNSLIHINGSPINVEGDMLISNTHASNNGTGLIRITGANNQTITSTSTAGRGELPNIEIDKSGGIATLIGVLSSNGNWEFINGNFDAATNTATVSLYGSNKTINGGNVANHMNFYTLRLNGNNIINTATGDIYVNNLLILNDADLLLNGHELTIENAMPAAISRSTGLIRSENQDNSSKINWNIGNTAGVFTFPFGNSNSNYIPVRFQVTDGGDVGTVSIATYSTGAADILPLPTTPVAVTNMNNRSGLDNSNNTIHRFWQVDKDGPSGTATVTYTYANADVQNNVIGKENLLQAHRYDKPTDTWVQPALPGQAADVIANTVSVSGVTQFSPWALFFEANNPPVIKNDTISVDEDNTLTITVANSILLNDSDVDGAGAFDGLTVDALISGPTHGTLPSWNPDGSFVYEPNMNYNGQDTIIFSVCDGGIPKLCAVDTVFITINPVNDYPNNSSSSITFARNSVNQIINLNVLNIVVDSSDPLGNVDPATVKITVAPMNGSISINPLTGVITYTPNPGFIGIDSYRYEACDDGNPLPSLCTDGLITMEFLADSDNDGVVDSEDLDDDNDGIPDYNEGCGELIINGSFEKQDFTDPLLFPGGFTGANGTFIGASFNSNELYGWNYTQNLDGWVEGGNWAPAFHGKQYLDVLGNNAHTAGLDNTLSQLIPTIPGNSYVLSFYWDEDYGHEVPEMVTLRASVIDSNNAMVFDITLNKNAVGPNGAGVRGPNDWQHFTQTFVATTTQTTIQFIATPPGGGDVSAGASLDLVSVMPLTLADCRDTDQDGIPDAMDLDSDGDGIYDVVEAGNSNLDNNHDGIIDGNLLDFGINGLYSGVETDDSEYATTNYQIPHNDLDGIPNYLDLDSDGDGIPDNVEGQATMSYTAPSGSDIDDNGVDDNYDTNGTWIDPVNTDGTDGADYVDADSDNDGIIDTAEAGLALTKSDADQDGLDDIVDTTVGYADPNGNIDIPNQLPDEDGDVLAGGDVDYRDIFDTDNDGITDIADLDDDNDGIMDCSEGSATISSGVFGWDLNIPVGTLDMDRDDANVTDWLIASAGTLSVSGVTSNIVTSRINLTNITALTLTEAILNNDYVEASFTTSDNLIDPVIEDIYTGRFNPGSGDSFRMGLAISSDNFNTYTLLSQDVFITDTGIGNAYQQYDIMVPSTFSLRENTTYTIRTYMFGYIDDTASPIAPWDDLRITISACQGKDTDMDGVLDHLDLDSDNDGIADVIEADHGAAYTDGRADGAVGTDGIPDAVQDAPDNSMVNYTIANTDTDSIPNYLDQDSDGDGIPDNVEGQVTVGYVAPLADDPATLLINEADTDGNGVNDAYDTNGTWIDPVNTDGVDEVDYLDTDSDNDGLDDTIEVALVLGNSDGDNDGLDDAADTTVGYNDPNSNINTPSLLPDIDSDVFSGGDVDYRDNTDDRPDTDNDGIVDAIDIDDDNDGVLDISETDACSGSYISFMEDFGQGNRTNTPYTNYCYEDGSGTDCVQGGTSPLNLEDGEYAILNDIQASASWASGAWTTQTDHTGDANGRMALFNASYEPGEFYNRTFTGLFQNTAVRFSFWILNLDKITLPNSRILPNVTVQIQDKDGNLLFNFNTGNIAKDEIWHNYTTSFNPGNNTEIKLVLINNAPGGGGNDLALDDISIIQQFCDTDNDGISNHLDLDSDNDGIYDIVENGVLNEAGVTDNNNDGMIDGVPSAFGNNGLFNGIENNDTPAGTITYTPNDTDSDSIMDAQELDADADGCNDVLEAGFKDPDFDGQLGESPIAVDDFGLVTSATGYTTPVQVAAGGFAFQNMGINNGCSLMAVDDSVVGGSTSFVEGNVLDNDVANYTDNLIVNTTPITAPTNGTLVLNADGSFTYTPNAGFVGQDSFVYEVCDDLIPQQCEQATVTITVTVLKISEGFSPNGDGINDYWFMEGINAYPLNKVKVFNRWGNMVYQTSGYNNIDRRWDGISTEGAFLGKKMLPEGTYFYVLDLGDGSKVIKGFITLKK